MFASNFGSGLFRLIQSLHRGDKTEYPFIPTMKAKDMNPKEPQGTLNLHLMSLCS